MNSSSFSGWGYRQPALHNDLFTHTHALNNYSLSVHAHAITFFPPSTSLILFALTNQRIETTRDSTPRLKSGPVTLLYIATFNTGRISMNRLDFFNFGSHGGMIKSVMARATFVSIKIGDLNRQHQQTSGGQYSRSESPSLQSTLRHRDRGQDEVYQEEERGTTRKAGRRRRGRAGEPHERWKGRSLVDGIMRVAFNIH